jgi:predicted anti-sigma-YlaC factor YlaD
MKKCEQIKDLILTDYIDGELDKNLVESIESHLLECGDCRAFLKEVKNNAALPFQKVLREPVPAQLWSAIKENIENENRATNPLEGIYEKLKGLIVFPKLVPVFASLVLMFLAGSVTLNTVHIQQAKDRDQGEYLVALLSPTGSLAQGDNNDLGTPIEHYFL